MRQELKEELAARQQRANSSLSQMPVLSEQPINDYESVRVYTPALSKSLERGLPVTK